MFLNGQSVRCFWQAVSLLSVVVYWPCDSDILSKKHDFTNLLELGIHLVTNVLKVCFVGFVWYLILDHFIFILAAKEVEQRDLCQSFLVFFQNVCF